MKKIFAAIFTIMLLQAQVSAVTLPEGTVIVVQPQREIDADEVKEGGTVNFHVLQPVKVNGQVVIKSGTEVTAQVVKKKNNFILGIPGEIQVNNFQILTSDNEIIRLRGSIIDKGDSKYWAHVGWFFLLPLLFVKGNDGKIPVNTSHTLYTMENIEL